MPAGVAALVEEEHEEHSKGVAKQQQQLQDWCVYLSIKFGAMGEPERCECYVLDEAYRIVSGCSPPAVIFVNQIRVVKLELHGRPAENVDAGVQKSEHGERGGRAHACQCLLDALGER